MAYDELRELIGEAVREQVKPDEAQAVLLSGGVDSSTVAYFTPELPTITGYYEGEAYDERPWADHARHDDHAEVEIVPQDFVENFDEMMEAISPPYGGPGTFGQFMVAKWVAGEGFETVLSGEGGDELFGGYARLHLVAGIDPPDGYESYELPPDYPRTVEEALRYDFERLPDLLRVDDQVTSYWGLLAVAPMTDSRVVNYALSLSPGERIAKVALKSAMRGHVADEILNRTDKRGFPVPFVRWAQTEPVKSFVEQRIGYVPDPTAPWDRQWWLDLCEASAVLA